MTELLAEMRGAARSLLCQGVVATVVLGLALGITASFVLQVLERADGNPS